MDKSRDHLTLHYGKSAQEDLPMEAQSRFVDIIAGGEKPSEALKIIKSMYTLKRLDHTIVLSFLRAAYPGIDLQNEGLSSRIIDSDYPNSLEGLNDSEFDEAVARIKLAPDIW